MTRTQTILLTLTVAALVIAEVFVIAFTLPQIHATVIGIANIVLRIATHVAS